MGRFFLLEEETEAISLPTVVMAGKACSLIPPQAALTSLARQREVLLCRYFLLFFFLYFPQRLPLGAFSSPSFFPAMAFVTLSPVSLASFSRSRR